MRVLYVGSALALMGMANASVRRWTFPDCEADNCYRAFINEEYKDLAPSFCLEFLASTTTDASVIPTPFANCAGDITAVSSACSCISYTFTHTATTSTPEVTPTSSVPVITTPTEVASSSTPSTTPSEVVTSPEAPPTTPPVSTGSLSTPEISSPTSSQPASSYPAGSYPAGSYPGGGYPASSSLASSSPANSSPVNSYPVSSSSAQVNPTGSASTSAVATVSSCTTKAQSAGSSSSSSASYWSLTTSTVYATTVYTVTSCAPSVTNCPATSSPYITTETFPLTETVYPVNPPSSYPVWTPSSGLNATSVLATSKGVVGPSTTYSASSGYAAIPTAAAARVGLNEVAMAAGALAIALL
ncbi:hypothetical protein F5Y01DRAFT_281202 [Xylaria sp. FL0043]|nr:hypothetical protein F5Y01DRAFT_281202 [Xylaria sp. FL0043]